MGTETEVIAKKHNMRLETFVLLLKLFCHLIIGVFTPWAAALAQWANSGEWPPKIIWIGVILPASAISGASALTGFLSGSYRSYQEKRKENGQ